MRSSSQLFPVALVSAEFVHGLAEDVYLLKPDRSPDPTVRLALTRVNQPTPDGPAGQPLVLLHGAFANRGLWFGADGQGLAAYLARAGFDVWLAELRGHGLSPRNQDYDGTRARDYWRDDLPAINDFIVEQSGRYPIWLGQGWSATLIAAALAKATLAPERVTGVALVGPRWDYPERFSPLPGINLIARWRLRRQGTILGHEDQGPEVEPYTLIRERMRWCRRRGLWARRGKGSAWRELGGVSTPLAVLMPDQVPRQQWQDAENLFQLWGSQQKAWLKVDAGHWNPGVELESSALVFGAVAEAVVWPRLEAWLKQLTTLGNPGFSDPRREQVAEA